MRYLTKLIMSKRLRTLRVLYLLQWKAKFTTISDKVQLYETELKIVKSNLNVTPKQGSICQ